MAGFTIGLDATVVITAADDPRRPAHGHLDAGPDGQRFHGRRDAPT